MPGLQQQQETIHEGLAQARTALTNMSALSPETARMLDSSGRVNEGYDLLSVLVAIVGDLAAELDTIS
jgi:hypothetical protein